jgi:soluble lytic murein transglycosylase-like protein
MNRKQKILAGAAVAALPFISHGYMSAEGRALNAYHRARARASVWLLDKLQRPYDLRLLVEAEARAQGVRPELAVAMVEQESAWNPAAIRNEPKIQTASYGLFQVLPESAKACPGKPGAAELLHPVANVKCGLHLMRTYLDRTKSTHKALMAYNGGERCLATRCPQAEAYAAQVLSRLL